MMLSHRGIIILKVLIHLGALIPIVELFFAAQSGVLGGEPVERIIHFTGIGGLNLLVITLLISPLARLGKMGFLMQARRLCGLYCFSYACLHILSFWALDLAFSLPLLIQELLKRPYIYLGMSAFILLFLLAITSFNFIRKKMGRGWQQLHNFIYLCPALIVIHFYWSLKSGWIEPTIYAVILLILLMTRKHKLNKLLKMK